MNVSIGDSFEKFVSALVKSGRYQSSSEVIREGLRLLKDQEDLRNLRLAELRKELQIGIDQWERGEYEPFTRQTIEDVKRDGRKRLAARRRKSA